MSNFIIENLVIFQASLLHLLEPLFVVYDEKYEEKSSMSLGVNLSTGTGLDDLVVWDHAVDIAFGYGFTYVYNRLTGTLDCLFVPTLMISWRVRRISCVPNHQPTLRRFRKSFRLLLITGHSPLLICFETTQKHLGCSRAG